MKYLIFFSIFFFQNCSQQKPAKISQSVAMAPSTQKPVEEEGTVPRKDTISFSTDYLMGKFDPVKHPDFVKIEAKYTSKKNIYFRKDAYEAMKKMFAAAAADGVYFIIHSATRNFEMQKQIWEGKWKGNRFLEGNINAAKRYPDPKDRALAILRFSSMPGTSRHHWGTDMDINNFTNAYFEKGKGLKEYQWLLENAAKYGFCQPYTEKGDERPDGYNEEKWHWSYVPVAGKLTKLAETKMKDEMITGFLGAETAASIGIVEKYVLGVNPQCKVQ